MLRAVERVEKGEVALLDTLTDLVYGSTAYQQRFAAALDRGVAQRARR